MKFNPNYSLDFCPKRYNVSDRSAEASTHLLRMSSISLISVTLEPNVHCNERRVMGWSLVFFSHWNIIVLLIIGGFDYL